MLKHISFNFQFTGGKTRSFEADLQHGSTMITGRNGRGKSLILEAFSFLLFGAQALRGVASDYKKIDASCRVNIRGKDYEIIRTKSKAEIKLAGSDEPLAAGTTTVNSFIVDLLGYDYDVYRISNWCAQGDIQALANMKPTARKEMIDQVAGLNQVDGLIEMVKQEAKVLKSGIAGVESALTLPIAPVKPGMDEQQIKDELDKYQIQLKQINMLLAEKKQLEGMPSPLAPVLPTALVYSIKPEMLPMPQQPEPLPEPVKPEPQHVKPAVLAQAEPEDVLKRIAELVKDLKTQQADLQRAKFSLEYKEQELRGEGETHELYEVLQTVRGTTVEFWQKQNDAWQQKLQYDKLKAQGDVNCPNCGHNHPVANDLLKEFNTADFPEAEPLKMGVVLHLFEYQNLYNAVEELNRGLLAQYGDELKQEETLKQLLARDTEIREYITAESNFQVQLNRYNDQMASMAERNAERRANWERECQQTTQRNDERLASWQRECQSIDERNAQAQAQYDVAVEAYNEAMADYNKVQQKLADLVLKEVEYLEAQGYTESQIESLQELQTDWKVYHQLYKQYEQLKVSYDTAMARVETEREQLADRERALAALVELKARVKTYLIPSLNRVASYLLSEMTGGEFNSIAIDDSFEVYVDGEPLRTMSGSGKDITNLALRIGLGRILTHKVLGMMMLDEIDQGMDAERAAFTWECIEKVTPQIGQVLVVSHKELHAENRLVVQ